MAFTKMTKLVWRICQWTPNSSIKSNKDPTTVVTTVATVTGATAAPEVTHIEEDVETPGEATTTPEMAIPAAATMATAWATPMPTKANRHQPQTHISASSAKQLATTKMTVANPSRQTNPVLHQVEKSTGQNQK
jgi:hypothetical protein